jgi:hypothetical protein
MQRILEMLTDEEIQEQLYHHVTHKAGLRALLRKADETILAYETEFTQRQANRADDDEATP